MVSYGVKILLYNGTFLVVVRQLDLSQTGDCLHTSMAFVHYCGSAHARTGTARECVRACVHVVWWNACSACRNECSAIAKVRRSLCVALWHFLWPGKLTAGVRVVTAAAQPQHCPATCNGFHRRQLLHFWAVQLSWRWKDNSASRGRCAAFSHSPLWMCC